ncbi:hypothetical protein PVL29_008988 [Vitis rotundifolia]|uniref:Uncharacterized protein n=1 Tax=Vitis rotundifolia TaxID=103349 RepID=A0AA38ZY22_VITRO|nr:hypothetical protein PVL29_008988 [Vitis rotundifolia]
MGKNLGFVLASQASSVSSFEEHFEAWKSSLVRREEGPENYCEVGGSMLIFERAIEESVLYLSKGCCSLKGDGNRRWIFVIDDTLCPLLPYYKKHHFWKLNLTSLEEWMRKHGHKPLGEDRRFFNESGEEASSFKIFLNLPEGNATLSLLHLSKVGYHGWTSIFFLSLFFYYYFFFFFFYFYYIIFFFLFFFYLFSFFYFLFICFLLYFLFFYFYYRIWGIVGDHWSSFEGPPRKRTFKLPIPCICFL